MFWKITALLSVLGLTAYQRFRRQPAPVAPPTIESGELAARWTMTPSGRLVCAWGPSGR